MNEKEIVEILNCWCRNKFIVFYLEKFNPLMAKKKAEEDIKDIAHAIMEKIKADCDNCMYKEQYVENVF
jgi:hypothetical protein